MVNSMTQLFIFGIVQHLFSNVLYCQYTYTISVTQEISRNFFQIAQVCLMPFYGVKGTHIDYNFYR